MKILPETHTQLLTVSKQTSDNNSYRKPVLPNLLNFPIPNQLRNLLHVCPRTFQESTCSPFATEVKALSQPGPIGSHVNFLFVELFCCSSMNQQHKKIPCDICRCQVVRTHFGGLEERFNKTERLQNE